MKLDDREKQNYQDLPQEARQKLREFLEKYKGNVDRSPHLYGEFIHSVFAKALLEQQMRMENAGLGAEAQDFQELGILYQMGEFSDGKIAQGHIHHSRIWPGSSTRSCLPSKEQRPQRQTGFPGHHPQESGHRRYSPRSEIPEKTPQAQAPGDPV